MYKLVIYVDCELELKHPQLLVNLSITYHTWLVRLLILMGMPLTISSLPC